MAPSEGGHGSRDSALVSLENIMEANESSDREGFMSRASALFALPSLRSKTFMRVKKGAANFFGEGGPDSPGRGDTRITEEEANMYFLKKDLAEARNSINKLEQKCEAAMSYREKASKLLEEALRALGRLEQAMLRKDKGDLIVAASELKANVQTGLTLINVYGGLSTVAKMATILMRKNISRKFDKVITKLSALCPSSQLQPTSTHPLSNSSLPSDPIPAPVSNKPLSRGSPNIMMLPGLTSKACTARDVAAKEPLGALPEGTIIKTAKHDKIYCIAPVPTHLANNGYINIWWSAGNMLEFWDEAGGSTTSFHMDKDSHVISAMGLDEMGNVWTGHIKGLLRVRQRSSWEDQAEEKAFGSQVRVITFDDAGLAWVGDTCGKVKVFRYHDGSFNSSSDASVHKSRLELVATLRQSLLSKITDSAKTMLVPNFLGMFSGRGPHQCGGDKAGHAHVQDMMSQGPVRAILVRDERAWISGGTTNCKPWLAMFDATTFQDLDVYECRGVGPINVMKALNWPAQTVTGPSNMARPSERNLATVSRQLAPASWRLLTGHENGQLLLWHPRANSLAPLIKIGEPMSSIRGIHIFEDTSLVITAHQCGQLQMFVQQRMDNMMMPPGSESAHPDSLGTLRPKKAVLKAHKSNLVGMSGAQHWFCTASLQGTIRMWQFPEIMAHVERAGLAVGPERAATLASAMSAYSSHVRNSSNQDNNPLVPTSSMASSGPTQTSVVRSRSDLTEQVELANRQGSNPPPTSGGSTGNDRNPRRHSSLGTVDGTPVSMPMSQDLTSTPTNAHPAFTSSCQTIDSSELTLRKVIGSGAYGKVWLAEWTGCAVAVKELMGFGRSDDDGKLWQEMANEVHLLGTYNHPNIMRFMAVCTDPPMIVMQYYAHGSLFDLLQRGRNNNARAVKELAWLKRLDMLRDVAAGMHYLHTRKPPVIHGDLRSPNLLLDLTIDRERPRFHVKIADFGLARMLGPASSLIMVSKTTNPRWTAPEVIKSSQIGPAGDVYSFAIIMWEMLTWAQPYEDMMSVQVILRTVNDNDRPQMPPDHTLPGHPGATLREYKQLMESCWNPAAGERPTFKQIVDMFQNMRDVEARVARSNSSASSTTPQRPAPASPAIPATPPTPHTPVPVDTLPTTMGGATVSTASNSASSVKSDTTAALIIAAAAVANNAAKDSASSMASSDAGQGKGGGQGKGVYVTAFAQQQGAVAGQQQGQGQQGSAFAMSPIREERSLSVDSHNLSFGRNHTTTVSSADPQATSVNAASSGSPFATASFRQGDAPINLLDGDDGSDPLEAYRSGAMDDFGYSLTGPGPSMAQLGRVAEENYSDGSRGASPARSPALGRISAQRPGASPRHHHAASPLGPHAAHTGASQDSMSLAALAARGRDGTPPQRPANPFGAVAVAWAATGGPVAGAVPAHVAHHPGDAATHSAPLGAPLVRQLSAQSSGQLAAGEGADRQLVSAGSGGGDGRPPTHRPSRSHDHNQFQQLHQRTGTPQHQHHGAAVGAPQHTMGGYGQQQHNRASPSGGTGSPARAGRSPASPAAFGSSAPAHHTPLVAGSAAHTSRLRHGAAATASGTMSHQQSGSRRTVDDRTVSQQADSRRTTTDNGVYSPINDGPGAHGGQGERRTPDGPGGRGMPPRARPSASKLAGGGTSASGTPVSSRAASPQRAPSGANSLSPDTAYQAASGARAANRRPPPRTASSSGVGGTGLARSISTHVSGTTHHQGVPQATPANAGRSTSGSGTGGTGATRWGGVGGTSSSRLKGAAGGAGAMGFGSPSKIPLPTSPGASSTASSLKGSRTSSPTSSSRATARAIQQTRSSDLQQQHLAAHTPVLTLPNTPRSAHQYAAGIIPAIYESEDASTPRSAAPQQESSPTGIGPLSVYRMSSAALGLPAEQPVVVQAAIQQQLQAAAGGEMPLAGKPYAPLSVFSPFSGAQVPFPDEDEDAADEGMPSAGAGDRQVNTAPEPMGTMVQSPGVVYGANTPGTTAFGGAGPGAAAEPVKLYAPLSKFSPFANAEQAAAPAPSQASNGAEDSKPYAPLSKFSPFANAGPEPAAQPAVPVAGSGSNGAEASKPYAPLSKFSPFAQSQPAPAAPSAASRGQAEPAAPAQATDSNGSQVYYAPLSKFSPFANAGQGEEEKQADPALQGKPWAPLSAFSPFAAAPAEPPQSVVASGAAETDGKPYAPLSAFSPFSSAASKAFVP